MKILILSRYQKTAQRGVENFVKELSKRLSSGNTVVVLSEKKSDSLGEILKGDYDVVIPVNGRIQSLKASLGRLFKGYKLIISGHSGIGRDDIWNIVLARPNVFVALTNHMADWAKKWALGIKIRQVPDGVDLVKFNPNGTRFNLDLEKPIILSVGALVWYKYHDKVIEAVSKLKKGSLLIVGKGPDEKKLEKLGKEKLGDRFKIMSIPYEEMPKIYRSADIFTLPSWDREAFGMVYVEAMASGLGVVAPDDRSRREIVGEAGLYVDVSNAENYAQVLEEALEKKWVKKATEQAKKFSWEEVAKQYERVIQDA